MAEPDHTVAARPYAAPGSKPRNPLGRPFWTLALAADPEPRLPATLAGLTMGVHALARLLANNEAFRDSQDNSAAVEPGHWPLDAAVTEGLFAALYFLSEQAEALSQPALDDPAID